MLNGFNQVENPHASNLLSDFRLSKFIAKSFEQLGLTEERAKSEADLIRIMLDFSKSPSNSLAKSLYDLLDARKANVFLNVNQYEGIVYFNKERYDVLLGALFALSALEIARASELSQTSLTPAFAFLKLNTDTAQAVGYKYSDLLSRLQAEAEAESKTSLDTKSDKKPSLKTNLKSNIKPQSTPKQTRHMATKKTAVAEPPETEMRFRDEVKKGIKKSKPISENETRKKTAVAEPPETEMRFRDEVKKGIKKSKPISENETAVAKKNSTTTKAPLKKSTAKTATAKKSEAKKSPSPKKGATKATVVKTTAAKKVAPKKATAKGTKTKGSTAKKK
jgi:hypothetical protein